jgi:energy-coupling factor transporter ATP-binding protein EcfA2
MKSKLQIDDGKPFNLGGYLKEMFRDTADLIALKWDAIFLVVGQEGDGKTTFVKTASYYLDRNTNINRWAYNAEQFEKAVDREDVSPGTCIVWDESDELSAHWANKVVYTLKRKFKRIRSKGLIIFLITPTFFDMNKYWSILRTRALMDVYANPKRDADGYLVDNRGSVRVFNKDRKRLLYFSGYKEWNMMAAQPNFFDRFGKPPLDYPVSEDELNNLKDEAMKSLLENDNAEKYKLIDYRQQVMVRLETIAHQKMYKFSRADLCFVFGLADRTLYTEQASIRKKVAENGLYARDFAAETAFNLDRLCQDEKVIKDEQPI